VIKHDVDNHNNILFKFKWVLWYCDEHAVGNVVCVDDRCYGNKSTVNNGNACLQKLPCNATMEATSVFFGVRSGNDAIQQ
jgi:hypothetical protein